MVAAFIMVCQNLVFHYVFLSIMLCLKKFRTPYLELEVTLKEVSVI